MRTYTVYLIRHGMNIGAQEGRYIGHTDVSLSLDGAKSLETLRDNFVYPPVEAVISSPLKRCTETAKILYPEKEAIIMEDYIECSFGSFENKTAEELKDNEAFKKWISGEKGAEPPFGEKSEDFGKRVCNIFEKTVDGLMKAGVFSAAIITHQGIISMILARYGLPQLPFEQWKTQNGCGFVLKIDPNLWMRGKMLEVYSEFPLEREEIDE